MPGLKSSTKTFVRNTQEGVIPPHQTYQEHTINTQRQVEEVSGSYEAAFNGESVAPFSLVVKKETVGKVLSSMLRLEITITGSTATLLPVYEWFTHIEFHEKGKPTVPFLTLTAAQLRYYFQCRSSEAQFRQMEEMLNSFVQNDFRGAEYGTGTHVFYLPFIAGLFEIAELHGNYNFEHDLYIRLIPRPSIIAAGSGTVALSDLKLIVQESHAFDKNVDTIMTQRYDAHYKRAQNIGFLDCQELPGTAAVALTAGVATEISLDSIRGQLAGMIVYIQSSNSITNHAFYDSPYLGRRATIDIVGASGNGNQKWGNGNAHEIGVLNLLAGAQFLPTEWQKRTNTLFLNFSNDPNGAIMHGIKDGYLAVPDQAGGKLRIIPDAAKTDPIITFDGSGVAASGSYRLSWAGEETKDLAYNTTAANIKVALDALQVSLRHGLTWTASGNGPSNTGGDFTLTISGCNLDVIKRYGMPALSSNDLATSAPASITYSPTLSTPWKDGSTVGGNSFYISI